MDSIVYLQLFIWFMLAYGAHAIPPQQQQQQQYPDFDGQKTADLTRLINETLTLNNKTLPKANDETQQQYQLQQSRPFAFKDDWTFERVEYDLMEFLQDLGARYQLKKESEQQNSPSEESIEARRDKIQATTESSCDETLNNNNNKTTSKTSERPPLETYTASIAASTTEISTSLASEESDHDIAESKWQYGIFDRFTRARASSTTTTTTRDPYADTLKEFDVRQYNSEECGLRTYEDRDRVYLKVEELDTANDASKDLNQRRQRPNLSLLANKKYQFQTVTSDVMDKDIAVDREIYSNQPSVAETAAAAVAPSSSSISTWANKFEKDAYDSYKQQQQSPLKGVDQLPASSLLDRIPSLGDSSSQADTEFNLASRRHWLQQQLGNTLQLLGFNGSAQSVAEFLNQTSGLSLNNRENMMKKSSNIIVSKLGKSLAESPIATPLQQQQQQQQRGDEASLEQQQQQLQRQPGAVAPQISASLSARQDELKLEARVIGGSDARLGDSPWSVSLQALVSRPGTSGVEYRHYCGGTIISEYYVLTAAHCLDFMVGRESRLFVVIGDLNWRMSTISVYGRRFGIDKLIIHSGYKSTAFGHDIGLIRTKESMKPLKSNGRYIVNSVCLPEKGVEHSGEAELVGWGLFSNRNEMADSLQIADVPILPRPLCVDLYKRRTGLIQWLIGIELITDKQICAGTFGRGICQGDSGSALVFNQKVNIVNSKRNKQLAARSVHDELSSWAAAEVVDKNGDPASEQQQQQPVEGIVGKGILRNSYEHREQLQSRATIIGIVAFGGIRRCSYQSLPGVYMQTSKYMDWILPRIQS